MQTSTPLRPSGQQNNQPRLHKAFKKLTQATIEMLNTTTDKEISQQIQRPSTQLADTQSELATALQSAKMMLQLCRPSNPKGTAMTASTMLAVTARHVDLMQDDRKQRWTSKKEVAATFCVRQGFYAETERQMDYLTSANAKENEGNDPPTSSEER
jgi:hypothetical protein